MKILIQIFFLTVLWSDSYLFAQSSDTMKPTTKSRAAKKELAGIASWYSDKFNGRRTASGEIFSQSKMTAACNQLPLGTWIRVTNLRNGKQVVVKVNDRLHPKMRRVVDLTRAAATELGFVKAGLTRVKVEVLGRKKPG